MTRVQRLLLELDVGQQQLADWLRTSRSVVSRLKTGVQSEDGPVSKLLDQVEAVLQRDGQEAARELIGATSQTNSVTSDAA